jgi:hypothetical protein
MLPTLLVVLGLLGLSTVVRAQDLVPGAYTPAPGGFNIVTIVTTFNRGDVTFEPSLPVEDGRATIWGGAVAYNRTLNLAGRNGSVGIGVPYVHGHIQGTLLGDFQEVRRSGFGDLSGRAVINLYGAPAMTSQEFAAYRPSTIVALGIVAGVPSGEYDSSKIINIGTNRWSLKPEIGLSRTRGPWTIEGDFGGVFFADNTNFRNGGRREQAPIGAVQGHLTYRFRPALWIACDANFWQGARTTTNGVEATEQQSNSRLGVTTAIPIPVIRRQLRIAYSFGAHTNIGGDFQSLGVSYSYVWAGWP